MTTAHGRPAVAGSPELTAPPRPMPGRWSSWLSNGRYRTLIAAHGGGSSACGDVALTRSRADALSIDEGLMVFVRDLESGAYWTLGVALFEAGDAPPEVRRESGRVEIIQRTAGLDCSLAITVAAERDCELRRLELRNHSGRARRLEVTTFCEVALLPFAADLSHPAFSRLFIETEFANQTGALLARRRPRGEGEVWPLMVHALSGGGGLEWESSRERFIGRGHDIRHPAALERPGALSGSTGRVLDPALCLRRTLTLAADGEATLTLLLGATTDREQALQLAETFATPEWIRETFERAAEQDEARGREHDLSAAQSTELESLAGALWCGAVRVMPPAEDESDLRDAGDRLSALGLKRDAVRVVADERGPPAPAETPRMIDRAARYWRSLGLAIECCALTRTSTARGARRESGVFEFDAATLASEELDALLRTASLLVSGDEWPEPAEQAAGDAEAGEWDSGARAARQPETAAEPFSEPLADFNGYGGFNAAADEYVIRIRCDEHRRAHLPPRPWVNVIANEHFGFLFSESGAGCTWSGNSREHRLTPWANDPLLDPHGEALYLRDELTGAFWSPLPGPAPATGEYETRHGFGYSVCRHVSAGLEQETCVFVPLNDPVKVVRLRVQNHGKRSRPLSLFAVQSLVLGDTRWRSARFIETRLDPGGTAVLARNRAAGEFAGRVAFASLAVHGVGTSIRYGGDRAAFFGEFGSARNPRALALRELDGGFGVALDPAFTEHARFELAPGQSAEIVLLLGEGEHLDDAGALIERYREIGAADAALEEVRRFWIGLTGTLRIETPIKALDRMVNGWLLYQTVSCRLWGRTALYQSGGAYGFRDQLQDSLALALARPDWTRAQLLLHASHQFVEGDVLHWWHPPGDRGLRTRVVDDLLWLPYSTAHYVSTTGDRTVLSEMAPYIRARVLEREEAEAFLAPEPARQFRDLYEHCCHAIDRSLALGAHGLPLFGTGDWNDGMNAVGHEGRGESVWMAFFLYAVLDGFMPLCLLRGDEARARRYQEHQERLREAIEREAWDGEWYRRGWYDDGTPLGTREGDECQIDAVAQAWATLSGAAPRERAEQALRSVDAHLAIERARLVRLLAPSFDRTRHNPGYIKGYVPGVRENGGQYTHAALWVARAMAESGRADRAAELLEWISPASRATTRADADTYQVEPYVVAADIYAEPPHVGLGGWTWYTGSSGWMYRTVIESLLGVTIEGGDMLILEPRWPRNWDQCRVQLRLPGGRAMVDIVMRGSSSEHPRLQEATLDGTPLVVHEGQARTKLPQDAVVHEVVLKIG